MSLMSKMNSGVLLLPLWVGVVCACQAQENPDRSGSRPGRPESAVLATGLKSYEAHCAMCHGLDARGGEHAPGIANSRQVQAKSDKELAQIIGGGISNAGMPSFGYLPGPEIGALVKYLRSLGGVATYAPVKGDPQHGETLFFGKAQCGDCHMLAGRGGFIASDLSDFAIGHPTKEIREAIVRPDQTPLSGHQLVYVETIAGRKFSGLVRNEDNFSMQLQGTDGTFHLFIKSQIAKVERTDHSLMPADYGTRLSTAELDDLVSFIARSGRRMEAPPASSGDRQRGRSR